MIDAIFQGTVLLLAWLCDLTGMTYAGANVCIWCVFLPLVFAILLDTLRDTWGFTCVAVLWVWALISGPDTFSAKAEAIFSVFARFLRLWEAFGMDYETASVVFCLVLPGAVLAWLLRKVYRKFKQACS